MLEILPNGCCCCCVYTYSAVQWVIGWIGGASFSELPSERGGRILGLFPFSYFFVSEAIIKCVPLQRVHWVNRMCRLQWASVRERGEDTRPFCLWGHNNLLLNLLLIIKPFAGTFGPDGPELCAFAKGRLGETEGFRKLQRSLATKGCSQVLLLVDKWCRTLEGGIVDGIVGWVGFWNCGWEALAPVSCCHRREGGGSCFRAPQMTLLLDLSNSFFCFLGICTLWKWRKKIKLQQILNWASLLRNIKCSTPFRHDGGDCCDGRETRGISRENWQFCRRQFKNFDDNFVDSNSTETETYWGFWGRLLT